MYIFGSCRCPPYNKSIFRAAFAFVLKNLHGGGDQIMAQTTWCMVHMEETGGGTGPEVGQSDNNILYY